MLGPSTLIKTKAQASIDRAKKAVALGSNAQKLEEEEEKFRLRICLSNGDYPRLFTGAPRWSITANPRYSKHSSSSNVQM